MNIECMKPPQWAWFFSEGTIKNIDITNSSFSFVSSHYILF